MEYVVTYGWAILAVIGVIGTLAYFGVLDPGAFLPDRCAVPAEFSCNEFSLRAADAAAGTPEVDVVLQNNLGRPLTILEGSREIRCVDCPAGQQVCPADCAGAAERDQCGAIRYHGTTYLAGENVTIDPGESFELLAGVQGQPCLGLSPGRLHIEFSYNYTKRKNGYAHRMEGEVLGRAT